MLLAKVHFLCFLKELSAKIKGKAYSMYKINNTKRRRCSCNVKKKNHCIIISIQKISSIHKFILKILPILMSHELNDHGHFWQGPLINFWIEFFFFWICTSMQKNQFILSGHFWDRVNFRVSWPDWRHQFLTMPTQNIFDMLLILVNLYQHVKNRFIPFAHSFETVNSSSTHFWPRQPLKFSINF